MSNLKENYLKNLSDNTGLLTLCIVLFAAAVTAACLVFPVETQITNFSLVMPERNAWRLTPFARVLINNAIIFTCSLLMIRLCNKFSLIRNRTIFPALFFLLFEGSNPGLTTELNTGNLLVFIFILSLFVLYSSYQYPEPQKFAFGISLMTSVGALLWPPYLFFLPVFWIGTFLMRAFTFKSFLASLMGIVTTIWVIFCLHWITGLKLYPQNVWDMIFGIDIVKPDRLDIIQTLWLVFTALIGISTIIGNLYRHYNDKTRVRASNGFINVVLICSLAAAALHFSEADTYMPILNACIALQCAHYFTHSKTRISIILFYIVISLYLILFIWSLFQHSASGAI